MASLRIVMLLAVAVAVVAGAEEQERGKKEIMMTHGMAMAGMEDDGSYYPGKYDKQFITTGAFHHGVMPYAAMPAYHPTGMTYSMGVMPAAYPYAYGHYPITKTMVY